MKVELVFCDLLGLEPGLLFIAEPAKPLLQRRGAME